MWQRMGTMSIASEGSRESVCRNPIRLIPRVSPLKCTNTRTCAPYRDRTRLIRFIGRSRSSVACWLNSRYSLERARRQFAFVQNWREIPLKITRNSSFLFLLFSFFSFSLFLSPTLRSRRITSPIWTSVPAELRRVHKRFLCGRDITSSTAKAAHSRRKIKARSSFFLDTLDE